MKVDFLVPKAELGSRLNPVFENSNKDKKKTVLLNYNILDSLFLSHK